MKIQLFEASITTITERFFLMMLVAGMALFTGIVPLIFAALPILLTAILGMKFEMNTPTTNTATKHLTTPKRKIFFKAA